MLVKTKQRFNIEALAIPQGFNGYETEEVKTSVKVRKPGKQEFFRVLGTEYRMPTLVLRLEKDKSDYLVAPELRQELASELIPVEIFTVVTIRQEIFLWPIRIPIGDFDLWNRSALIAAREAQFSWVRIIADLGLGEYRIQKAISLDLEPQLPDESFEELLKQAFRDHYIDSMSHHVVKNLRGETE